MEMVLIPAYQLSVCTVNALTCPLQQLIPIRSDFPYYRGTEWRDKADTVSPEDQMADALFYLHSKHVIHRTTNLTTFSASTAS